MTAHLMIQCGLDPDVLVGGVVASMGSNVRVGHGALPNGAPRPFVLETDESDNRLHEIIPALPIVTNIDNDHLDHFGTLENLQAALTKFLISAKNSGDPRAALLGCGDDARVKAALEQASRESGLPWFDYGFGSPGAAAPQIRAMNLEAAGMNSRFDVSGPWGLWRNLVLPMPGRHNVLNALGALTAAWHLGASEDALRAALANCERVGRRFEIKSVTRGVRVVDDYGHHPTELTATFRAARSTSPGRLAVLFQPHRYTRTAALLDDFAACLAESGAHSVWLLPVYAASEEPLPGVSHETLAARARSLGHARVEALNSIRRPSNASRLGASGRHGDDPGRRRRHEGRGFAHAETGFLTVQAVVHCPF